MNFGSIAKSCCFMMFAAGTAAGGAGCAIAQEYRPADETIIVEAPHPYIEREILGRSPDSRLPLERVSYSVPVDIADLDLASPSDRTRLEDRIYEAAWQACRELDRHFPPSIYVPTTSETRRQCADRAADDGMARARMIADARAPAYGRRDDGGFDDRFRDDDRYDDNR